MLKIIRYPPKSHKFGSYHECIYKRLQLEESLFRKNADANRRAVVDSAMEQQQQEVLCNYVVVDSFAFNGNDDELLTAATTSSNHSNTIVVGLSGNTDELINVEKCKQNNVPIIRRFSGGGTIVLNEHDMVWYTIIGMFPSKKSVFPRELMQWTGDFVYEPTLRNLFYSNIDVEFKVKENDYVINDYYKFGGNAQSISRNNFLHHTSILWRAPSQEALSYLLLPKKIPEYRNNRKHEEFVRGLQEFLLPKTTKAKLVEGLVKQTVKGLNIETIVEMEEDEINALEISPTAKTKYIIL